MQGAGRGAGRGADRMVGLLPLSVADTRLEPESYPVQQAARPGQQVVERIARDPGHAGQRDQEAKRLPPVRVLVSPHSDRAVPDKVEHKDEQHEGRGQADPADQPVGREPVANHLFHTVVKVIRSEHPADGHSLEEDAPEQRESTGRVEVHQLENVHAAVGDHGKAEQEHEEDERHRELAAVGLQLLRPVVHQTRHLSTQFLCKARETLHSYQWLHAGELSVEAEVEQHGEEEDRPKRRRGDGENNFRVDEEGEAGPRLHHLPHLHSFLVRHEAQDGEYDGGGKNGSKGVDTADEDCVLMAVVVELIIASQGEERPNSHAVREEDLGSTV